jgi:hypothetical protein
VVVSGKVDVVDDERGRRAGARLLADQHHGAGLLRRSSARQQPLRRASSARLKTGARLALRPSIAASGITTIAAPNLLDIR